MRPNETKRLLASNRPAVGTFSTSGSPLIAEALGRSGYDFVIVDLQHGENNFGNLMGMLQAISCTPATPIVRVPGNDPVYIQRALDLGAYGIVIPMVNTRAEAEAVVPSFRYAPRGNRSWGPVRGSLYGGADYLTKSHEELLTIVMLETREAVKNAQEILSVSGIDGCFIGTSDLSVSLGFSSDMAEYPRELDDAIHAIRDAALATGKAPGIYTPNIDWANARIAEGFRFVCVQHDLGMIQARAAEALRIIKR